MTNTSQSVSATAFATVDQENQRIDAMPKTEIAIVIAVWTT